MIPERKPLMLEPERQVLTLTAREIVFLTDAIANSDEAAGLPDHDAHVPLAREILLLLGSAYLEVVDDEEIAVDSTVDLSFNEEQVWLLRTKASTSTMAFDKKVIGPQLMRKLYAALLRFHSGLDVVAVEEPEYPSLDEVREKLREFNDRSASPSTGTNTDQDSSNDRAGRGRGDGPGQDLSESERKRDTDNQPSVAVETRY